MSCTTQSNSELTQKQLLEIYIGQLAIENAKTLTYQTDGLPVHTAKYIGTFADLFVEKAQYLDEEYRADYLITGLWSIELQGGAINQFADVVALRDCSNDYFFDTVENFLAEKESGEIYQKWQYKRVEDVYQTILVTCDMTL